MTSTPDFEASNFLESVGHVTQSISTCLRHNKLNTKKVQKILSQYSSNALSDGRLIDTARSDDRCVDHATYLLLAHIDLVTWLVAQNYTITSSSVKFYNCKALLNWNNLRNYQLWPKLAQLQELMERIREKETLVRADIAFYQVS
jgi:hypothetical protein